MLLLRRQSFASVETFAQYCQQLRLLSLTSSSTSQLTDESMTKQIQFNWFEVQENESSYSQSNCYNHQMVLAKLDQIKFEERSTRSDILIVLHQTKAKSTLYFLSHKQHQLDY